MRVVRAPLLAVSLAAAACSAPPRLPSPAPAAPDWCGTETLLLDAHFGGGQLGRCVVREGGLFELTFSPEDAPPINDSPWYAFRVSGQTGEEVTVRMAFEGGHARYWPKLSTDRQHWAPVPPAQVTRAVDARSMELRLDLHGPETWVAGEELLTGGYYRQWLNELLDSGLVTAALAGHSAQGRPIYRAWTGPRPETVLLLGRQHPPEVTGAIAMRAFVAELLGDSRLAAQFRSRYGLVIFPLLNPDGVAEGHWRHNTDGVDINRDWGPFSQPETQAVRRWLDALDRSDSRLRLMLDFHSTRRNLFYTQLDTDATDPPEFAARWLGSAATRLPGYAFTREARGLSGQANSKNYFFSTYRIPAITYETGDETARAQIESSAVVFAQEMMRAMLAYPGIANGLN